MAVRCVFFMPGSRCSCQVLRLMDASPRSRQTQNRLESRFCLSGRFIACPVFCRVEQGLVEANRIRGSLARPVPSGESLELAPAAVQPQPA